MTVDLVFDANTNRSCVNVTTTEDDIYEGSEVFDVNLEAANTGVTVAPDEGEITITDEDGTETCFSHYTLTDSYIFLFLHVAVVIGFVELTYFVNEMEAGFVEVSAEMKQGVLETAVVVEFSTSNGSARGKPR